MIRKSTLALSAAQQAATVEGLLKPVYVAVQLFGTFTATFTFEMTVDGTNWTSVELVPSTDLLDTALTATATTAGIWVSKIPLAATAFRARCSAFTSSASGVATVRAA